MQFNGAYDMLKDLDKHNLEPKAGMYNAIMAGHFREVTSQFLSFVIYFAVIKFSTSNSLSSYTLPDYMVLYAFQNSLHFIWSPFSLLLINY